MHQFLKLHTTKYGPRDDFLQNSISCTAESTENLSVSSQDTTYNTTAQNVNNCLHGILHQLANEEKQLIGNTYYRINTDTDN